MTIDKWIRRVASVVAVSSAVVLVSLWQGKRRSEVAPSSTPPAAGVQIPRAGRPSNPKSGPQILVVFIGSSTCGASNHPELVDALKKVRTGLIAEAKRRNAAISFMGVATDWSLVSGLRFLTKYGPFDQVAVGNNWLNAAAIQYIWRDLPGTPSLPQIVVVERELRVGETQMSLSQDRVISRKIGVDELVAWSRPPFRL